MATVIGDSIAGSPAYPSRPEVKVVVDTPNPHGYTEQSGQYGSRAGTIIPHNDPSRSFADQQKPRHNVPISVVAFREPSAQNPFGGFEMLVPPIPSESITEEIRTQATQRAQQMHSDPVSQGVAAYKMMAELINAGPTATPAPPAVAPPTEHFHQDPPPAMPPMSMEAMMNMARLFGVLQAQQAAPAAVGAAAPPPPPPALPAIPAYPPPGPVPPLPPAPPPPQAPGSILDSLLIPGLGAVPSKPLAQVQFDLGPLGNQMSFWHWVVETKTALCLVFDTRYDYPMWTPPNLGAEQPINVTLHNTQKGPLAVPCFSCGLNFRFGVFECTILVFAADG